MTALLSENETTELKTSSTLVTDLTALGRFLLDEGYDFTTVTPTTHARVLANSGTRFNPSLRDIFGWNQSFTGSALPEDLISRMESSGLLAIDDDGLMRSTVRFATLNGNLYVHDAYPTIVPDAVFFGPDTYRFIAAVRSRLKTCDFLVDVCCGSGAGGLEAGSGIAERVVLADINPKALAFAEVNCRLRNNYNAIIHQADLLSGIDECPNAIIANPPYLADPFGRTYRDGSGKLGTGLALRILKESITFLAPGGQLLLYTGSPVIDGVDQFAADALPLAHATGAKFHYEEIDPDVFGEELDSPQYVGVERIAAVILTLTMP